MNTFFSFLIAVTWCLTAYLAFTTDDNSTFGVACIVLALVNLCVLVRDIQRRKRS